MKLKIAVLVKQVPDHEAIVRVKSDLELEIENRYVCSYFDEIAMETALNIKKSHPDSEISALSAGGKRAADALRRAVAMGIDQVEHLGDESLEKADSYYIAAVLASRLQILRPDLIICGKQAGDDDFAAVGAMVAELLSIPHASAVVTIGIDEKEKQVTIGREVEGEIWFLKSGFPLLLTAEKGLAEPHIPVVTRVMKAMRARVPNIPVEELDLEEKQSHGFIRRLRYLVPPTRPEVVMMTDVFPQNVKELVDHLKKQGVL